jgi:hypothetical protein
MFDVSRLQDTSNLAKELVEKGIAKDFDEALKIIESNNMVKSNEEFKTIKDEGAEQTDQKEKSDSEQPKQNSMEEKEKMSFKDSKKENNVSTGFEELQDKLSELKNLLENYIEQNDRNLQELDERLKKLESQEGEKKEPQQKIPKKKGKKPQKHVTGAGEGLNPDDFAVDKIFNNSNGRLDK